MYREEETYPFINHSLNQGLSGGDRTALTNDGDVDQFTSLGTRTILALCGHLDIGDTGSLLDLLDLCTFGTDDLAGTTIEDLHQLLSLLLRVVVAVLVATFNNLWLRLGDEGAVLLVALVSGLAESVDDVLERVSFGVDSCLLSCHDAKDGASRRKPRLGKGKTLDNVPSSEGPSNSSSAYHSSL
jgi:hypothetical protein